MPCGLSPTPVPTVPFPGGPGLAGPGAPAIRLAASRWRRVPAVPITVPLKRRGSKNKSLLLCLPAQPRPRAHDYPPACLPHLPENRHFNARADRLKYRPAQPERLGHWPAKGMQISTLIKQVLVYSPGVLVPALTQLLALTVFTRLVDPDAYGRFVLVVSTAHLVEVFTMSWIRIGQMRFYEAENQKNQLASLLATMSLSFLITLICVVPISIIFLMLLPLDSALSNALLVGIGYLILRSAVLQSLARYRTAGKAKRYTIVEIGRALLGFAAAVVLVLAMDRKDIGLLLGITFGYGVVWAFDLREYSKMLIPSYFDKSKLQEIFGYVWPVIIQLTLVQLMTVSDRYMIGFFLDAENVGLYSVGFNVAQNSIGLIFTMIVVASYPLLLKEFEIHGADWARDRIRHNFSLILAVCLPAAVGLAITSDLVATTLLGQKYRDAGTNIIPWIALSTFVAGLRLHVYAHVFPLFKRVDLTLKMMTLVVGTNFVLNAFLIPRIGITGAILATVAADSIGLALYVVVGRRLMPLDFPLRDASRILTATALMAASLAALDFPKSALGLAAAVSVGITVYGFSAFTLDILGARTYLLGLLRNLR